MSKTAKTGVCCGLLFGKSPYLTDYLFRNANSEDWGFLQKIFNENIIMMMKERSCLFLKTKGYGTQCQISGLGLCDGCGQFERAQIEGKKKMLISFLSSFGIDFNEKFGNYKKKLNEKLDDFSLRLSSFECMNSPF